MIYSSAASNKGLVSPNNEDNIHLNGEVIPEFEINDYVKSMENKSHTFLAAVFDGMGGEKAGRKASMEAAKCLKSYYDRINYEGKDFQKNIELLGEYVDKTNRHIYKLAEQDGYKDNMGTTFACLYVSGKKAVSMNLGNSRVYMYRNGSLMQISRDHTDNHPFMPAVSSDHTDNGIHNARHIFDRYLGIPPQEGKMKANISEEIELNDNDIFILCSDGLTNMLTDKEIGEIVENSVDTNQISRHLMDLSLENGGKDNISVITVKYTAIEQYQSVRIPNLYSRTHKAKKRRAERRKRLILISAFVLAAFVVLTFGLMIINHNSETAKHKSKAAVKDNLPIGKTEKDKDTPPVIPKTAVTPAVTPPAVTTGETTPGAISSAPAATQPTRYIVQRGDTLQSISKKFYGDRKYYAKIREDNKLTPAGSLRTGQVLLIYPMDQSPNSSNPSVGSANTPSPTTNSAVTPDADASRNTINPSTGANGALGTPSTEKYYIVKAGDSLSKISEKFYGTKNNYKAIMQANGLNSANALRPGQKLIIP